MLDLQICGTKSIDVEFASCNKNVTYYPNEFGIFNVAPGDDFECDLDPAISVTIGNKTIEIDASFYLGQQFGPNNEAVIAGYCI